MDSILKIGKEMQSNLVIISGKYDFTVVMAGYY